MGSVVSNAKHGVACSQALGQGPALGGNAHTSGSKAV